jgi:RHS repeat-associated protein
MNKIISIFLTLLLFYFSSIPVLQTPFTPQKVYAETCIYVMDGQRNIRFVTDEIGNKVRSTEYDPFGNVTGTQGALTGNRYQFQTQQNDSESGMYYLRARYYDPTTGRFISRDPIKGTLTNPITQNPYAYAGNNPINNSDPSGEDYTVCGGFNSGALNYVGITCRDLAVRAAEHITSGDPSRDRLLYDTLHTVPDLFTAKGAEQSYIDTYGLAKNGGQLINQINSIAPNNPILSQAKDQAQAIGAVPAASSGIMGAIGEVGAALIKFPLIYMGPYPSSYYYQQNQQAQQL